MLNSAFIILHSLFALRRRRHAAADVHGDGVAHRPGLQPWISEKCDQPAHRARLDGARERTVGTALPNVGTGVPNLGTVVPMPRWWSRFKLPVVSRRRVPDATGRLAVR